MPKGDAKPQTTSNSRSSLCSFLPYSLYSFCSNSLAEEQKKDVEITDAAITTIMEFMAVPKAEAISLLRAYDGNLDNIFASWMT